MQEESTRDKGFVTIEMTRLNEDGTPAVEVVPQKRETGYFHVSRLFLLVFVAPVLLTVIHQLTIAADQYVSEAQFMVRASSERSLGALLQSQSISRSLEETEAVNVYMRSRDMVQTLAEANDLKSIYSRPEADVFVRFPNFHTANTFERLYEHFRDWTQVSVDPTTGIATLRVFAFRAEDARSLSNAMVQAAERLVNNLNARAYADRIAYAEVIVQRALDEVSRVEARMTEFRTSTGTVDVSRESTVALESIGKLTTEIAQLEVALNHRTTLAPNNPALPSLRQRIASYNAEIESMRRKVVGAGSSMAQHLAGYERLMLERQLVARSLEAANVNYDKARQEAEVPHVYLVRIAEANLPDSAEYPKRLRRVFMAALLAFASYVIVRAGAGVIGGHKA